MSDKELSVIDDFNVQITQPTQLSSDASPEQIKKDDIDIYNMQMEILYAAWSHARTLPAVLALMRETREMQKHRRNILGFTYGPDANRSDKRKAESTVFEPLS